MLDLNLIRQQPDLVRTALKNRQIDPSPVDDILRLDEKRRALLTQVETLKAERNAVSKEIGRTLAPRSGREPAGARRPGASAGVASERAPSQ